MALKVIKTDSIRLKEEAKELRTRIGLAENTFQELSAKAKELSEDSQEKQSLIEEVNLLDEQLEAMRVKLNILEVQSEINLPDVRWRVANAMGQLPFCFFCCGSIIISFQCSKHEKAYS